MVLRNLANMPRMRHLLWLENSFLQDFRKLKKNRNLKKKQYSDVLVNIFFENLVIMPSISAIFYLDGLSDIPK